jgi:F-type H+-transporting ATPase subunit gamma
MAVAKLRQVRRRIRSVQSTKKITRAMELIAASRIVKAQQRVAAARPYSEEITKVIANLAATGAEHPLLAKRDPMAKIGLVVLSADRGLAGSYNSNVIRTGESRLRQFEEEGGAGGSGVSPGDRGYELFLVGRKAQGYFRFRGYSIKGAYLGMSDTPSYEDARTVAGEVMAAYEAGEVDIVEVAYTQFLSAATQRPVLRRLLPVEGFDGNGEASRGAERSEGGDRDAGTGYEFEPEDPAAILDKLLPRYVEARLFAAMLDASASEHAARQRAMKAATDNADDLIKTLTRVANRARQTEITTEIMEIVGGAEALRQADNQEEG